MFNNIKPKEYLHPMENKVTETLKNRLINNEYALQLEEFYKTFDLQNLYPDLIGKSLEVTPHQFSNIYNLISELSKALDMPSPPTYIFEGRYCDANAEGLDEPWIQISTKTLEDYTDDELAFIIARQLVHIKLGHMFYEIRCEQFSKALGIVSQFGTSLVNFIPGGSVASQQSIEIYGAHFKIVAAQWSRVSEFTADRCAYVMCGCDINTAISAIKKQIFNSRDLSNSIILPDYLNQTKTILKLDKPVAKYSILDELYPYGPIRLKELIAFASTLNIKRCLGC